MYRTNIWWLVLGIDFLICSPVTANTPVAPTSDLHLGKSELQARYIAYTQTSNSERGAVNFSVKSAMIEDIATGHVYSILDHSYDAISKLLTSLPHWCDAIILNVNIKSCTYEQNPDSKQTLSLYAEDEHYVRPEYAHYIQYLYKILYLESDYLRIHMSANEGPYDTHDYLFIVEVLPLNGRQSFIHIAYSAHFGVLSRVLLNAYLATIGRHKVGFTVVPGPEPDREKFIQGIQAVMERNTVRYLMAFQAYLDTLSLPRSKRFMASLKRWHSFSELFRPQLYELNLDEYINNKQREFANQQALQSGELLEDDTFD